MGTEGIATAPHVTIAEPIRMRTARGEELLPCEGTDRYTAMFEHFADACLNDIPLGVTGDDGARNLAVIEAAYQSSRERKFISL